MVKIQNYISKIVTIVGCIIFILSCNTNGQEKKEIACIDNIYVQDDSLGSVRNYACEKMPLSKAIDQYVTAISNLDFSNCPESFSQAFNDHVEAWIAAKKVTDSFPELRGEMHDLFDEIEKSDYQDEFKSLVEAIWSTWAQVEKAETNAR